MTGLNLESYLHLLRADFGAWASLGAMALVFALLVWTSWGSRRALRKCLVLSVAAHVGLAVYGSTLPVVWLALRSKETEESERERIKQIKVSSWVDAEGGAERVPAEGRRGGRSGGFDRAADELALADPKLDPARPSVSKVPLEVARAEPEPLVADAATPDGNVPDPPRPEPRAAPERAEATVPPPQVTFQIPDEIAPVVVATESEETPAPAPAGGRADRVRPPGRSAEGAPAPASPPSTLAQVPPLTPSSASADVLALRSGPVKQTGEATTRETRPPVEAEPAAAGVDLAGEEAEVGAVRRRAAPAVGAVLPDADLRRRLRPMRSSGVAEELIKRPSRSESGPIALSRVTPSVTSPSTARDSLRRRPISEVPEVYRSRLDPNRSARAQRSGASTESEQAVERALDWLARHQDRDGRWDAATGKYDNGEPFPGDDDYTVHCPPGETCFGECIYWEADTALTGLSLLAYLGAGYTHADGKYRDTVGRGLGFLLRAQTPEGDLRGGSRAVGMYCHAMATLALCEAYALTGDRRLRVPVERAVKFLVDARARDGMSWRYAPGAASGDTSILGWVVMALKSAREVGIPVSASVQNGALNWLEKCAGGKAQGLSRYQPQEKVTPTMTAEAWACRQFLGVGGPGPASTEAAAYLLKNGPEQGTYNLYYWYYGTLAIFQHGGDAWERWNAQVRDQIVRRQRVNGHQGGSWDPDDSIYGTKGGRIYCTALATLSLEVYYRFLRLYDAPKLAPRAARRP